MVSARLSVPALTTAAHFAVAGMLLWSSGFAAVGPAGRRYRSIAAAVAGGGRIRAVPRCQRT